MTEVPNITVALYAQTDVGMVRSGNEDNFLILDLSTGQSWIAHEEENHALLTYGQGYYGALLAVSDGMGGALAGEVASRMAVETVRARMLQLQAHDLYGRLSFPERLRLAVEDANALINEEGSHNPSHRGLGATFTAVATLGDRIYFAQVGDSRAYLLRNGRIARITKDQSLVQQLLDAGQITEEEAETHQYKNVILQALGAQATVNVEVSSLPLRQYDTLLLCSDGLSGKMHADEIARIVHSAPDLKSACHELIALANERGGEDNITVIIAQFSGAGLQPPEDREPLAPESLTRAPDTPSRIQLNGGSDTTQPLSRDVTDSPAPRSTQPIRNSEAPTDQSKDKSPGARRRSPTAVFGRDDYEQEAEAAGLRQPEPVAARVNDDPPPVAAASAAAVPASADDLSMAAAARQAALDDSPDFRRKEAAPKGVKLTPARMITVLLFLGLLTAGLILARTYFQRSKQTFEQTATGQEVQRDNLKKEIEKYRGILGERRTKLLQLPDTRKESIEKSLNDAATELSYADQLLAESKFADVSSTLKRVEDLINKLDEEIKKLSNLLPFRTIIPRPVRS